MNPYPPVAGPASGRQFTRHEVVDHQNGMVVSTFEHPGEWQAQSRVRWNLQHTDTPAEVYAAAYNPRGAECFEFLPLQGFYWLEGGFGVDPIGQTTHGLVFMPPRPAPDALAGLVIPHLRRDRHDLRVTHVRPAPNLWQQFNDPPPHNGEGVMARVEYSMQGLPVEEEFYGVFTWMQTMQLNWGFNRLVCFRAERGRLNASRETFWRIASSLRPNPQWGQHYEHICQQLRAGHRAHIEATLTRIAGEVKLREQIIANSNDFLAQRDAQLNASLEAERRRREAEQSQYREHTLTDARGEALSGQTAYQNPNDPGNFHYEDSSSQYVWTDGMGKFQSTNDPFDDPNQSGDGKTWTRARRADGRD